MRHILILGRDMNDIGTDIGPQVELILSRALREYRVDPENTTLVVAPGYSPDFPEQPRPYAAMMADWLRQEGCCRVVELCSQSFDTYGELREFRAYCKGCLDDTVGVCGFNWHLPRAFVIAYQIDVWRACTWARSLKKYPVRAPMPEFDRSVEWKKWVSLLLPRTPRTITVRLYKRFISTRTSY